MKAALITGPPGSGKSTTIRHVLRQLGPLKVCGILSGEIRIDGRRQGFTIEAIGGESGLLASPQLPGEPRFGTLMPDGRRRLGLSLEHMEEYVYPTVSAQLGFADAVIVDEIGMMQAESELFRAFVEDVLDSQAPFLASVSMQDDSWLERVRNHPRVGILPVTKEGRDLLGDVLSAFIIQSALK